MMQTSTSAFSADFVYLLHAPPPGARRSLSHAATAGEQANEPAGEDDSQSASAGAPDEKPSEAPLAQGDVPEQDGNEDPGASLEFMRDVPPARSPSHPGASYNKVSPDH